MTALIRTVLPTTEPLTLAEAKAHLRVDGADDDTLINSLIMATRMMAEEYTRRAFITQSWRLWLDAFPGDEQGGWWDGVQDGPTALIVKRSINLPRAPLQSVTVVQTYDDANNATTFLSGNYFVDTGSEPGRLALRNSAAWPQQGRAVNGISIDFVAGYGAASAVPQPLKQGMLAHMAQLYEQRGDGVLISGQAPAAKALPEITTTLYAPYRLLNLVSP